MKKLFAILTMVVMAIVTYSQAPQKLSYQAVIRNSSGQLVTNHAVGMKISILQGSATGTVVYSETYNPVPQTNVNGLLTIEIGGGSPGTGTFSSINWGSGTYYLKTEADPAGGNNYTIVGTSQLISVPYALHAKNAASYTETDPVFGAAPAKAITSGLISNWNTAYGWGNHAGLYRPISYVPAWNEITSKPTTVSGYGISDAVTLAGNQTITGIKLFSGDLFVNGLTIGLGATTYPYNTVLGNNALSSNSHGNYNSAIGFQALNKNTEGSSNTAVGSHTLLKNLSGQANTAIGTMTLYSNVVGTFNTAVGFNAGYSNEAGNENIFLGSYAGYYETGSNKLYIDNQKRASDADAMAKALIYGVFNASPANQILTINGKVGIGTISPSSQLHLMGSMFVQNGGIKIGNSQGMITENWWEFGTDSNNGTAIDFHSNTTAADYSARIYRTAGDNGEFQIANRGSGPFAFYTDNKSILTITHFGRVGVGIVNPAYTLDVAGEITSRSGSAGHFRLWGTSYSTFLRNDNTDFYILLTNAGNPDGGWNTLRPLSINLATGNTSIGGGALTVLHGGNVGIGTSSPGTKLAISGLTGSPSGAPLIISGGNVYFMGSTREIKDNIQPLDDDFTKILNASPVSFTDKNTGMKGIGYIAEEFEDAGLQNLLVYENGKLVSLRYDLISVYNLEIIKELQKHLESVEEENHILRDELDELKADMNKLKRKLR